MESFNTRYYPLYRSLVSMMAWLPIFFMYFNDGLDIKEVILLESIYYFGVFVLEVPSGYFSDVLGRKITLTVSAIAFSLAYLLFGFTSPNFVIFAMAQILLACGYSFMSGTNTSFYYESLQDQGLEDEFPQREAKVQSYLRYSGGLAALIGGIVGSVQLRYGFGISLLFMMPALVITFKFSEPKIDEHAKIALPLAQLGEIWNYLKSKELRWMFIYSTIIYILSHIPYEFYQPYLTVLEKNDFKLPFHAALFSGLLFAGTRVLGAIVAANSVKLSERYGLRKLCYTSIILQLVLIGVLAAVLHPTIILIILFRSVSNSLTAAPINAEIAPRLRKEHRATYFSVQSLLSRFSFSVTLILLAIPISAEIINDWATVSYIFKYSFIGGCLIAIPLLFLKAGNLFNKKTTSF